MFAKWKLKYFLYGIYCHPYNMPSTMWGRSSWFTEAFAAGSIMGAHWVFSPLQALDCCVVHIFVADFHLYSKESSILVLLSLNEQGLPAYWILKLVYSWGVLNFRNTCQFLSFFVKKVIFPTLHFMLRFTVIKYCCCESV